MFTPGQRVEWHHESRRGYCPSWWVPAVVVRATAKRVTIDAYWKDATTRRRVVTPERVRERAYLFGPEKADASDPLDNPLFAVPTAAEVAALFADLGAADPFL